MAESKRSKSSKRMYLDSVFNEIQAQLSRSFNKSGTKAESHFADEFGDSIFRHTAWSQLLRVDGKNHSLRNKLALIAAARLSSEDALFEYALTLMKARDPHKDDQIKKLYDGYYRYWRYFPDAQAPNPKLRNGLIRLETTESGSVTTMEHWSQDALRILLSRSAGEIRKILPNIGRCEDKGVAIFTLHKIFMLGFREGNIRLAIGDLRRPETNIYEEAIHGIVLTNLRDRNVYAAKFIMINEKSPLFDNMMDEAQFDKIIDGEIITPKYMLVIS